jgi:hypothetical protein
MTEDNQKPDYSFIMNQPGPELAKSKRSKKPFILLAVAVVVLGSFTAAALLVGKKSTNVQQVATGRNEGTQFLNYIANNDTSGALQMYSEADRPDQESFNKNIIDGYGKRVDFKSCTFQENLGNVNNGGQNILVFRCPKNDNPAEHYIDFYLGFSQASDGTFKLRTFMVKEIKQ